MRWRIFGLIYRSVVKPILFLFSPDTMHNLATATGEIIARSNILLRAVNVMKYSNPILSQTVCGLNFKNPIGLAAGFDKDGYILETLPSLGFGFSSVGTVTNCAYEGNPKPWATRLIKSRALTVNYGLKNEGVDVVSNRLRNINLPNWYRFGVSIGKTNSQDTVGVDEGIADYVACFKQIQMAHIGDWYEINISCPNTFGGEPYTSPERLTYLLQAIFEHKPDKPVFVKMPINLVWTDFKELVDVCLSFGVQGLIIGNLNKDRLDPAIKDTISENIKGGISGKPTEKLSNELISQTYSYAGDKIIIIGVGGIFSAEDAYEKIQRGASLVQLITGMIYNGPQLIGQINLELSQLLERDGYQNIGEAVGVKTLVK